MKLWEQFDRMVIFDTETTGIDFVRDRIIEIGAVVLKSGTETDEMDIFIRLPEGRRLDPFITGLTGITEERLEAEGIERGGGPGFCGTAGGSGAASDCGI